MEASPPPMELSVVETLPSEWTDEKHCQYLKSMEASFVNQLYDSMEPPCWHSDKDNFPVSRGHDQCVYSPSGQFKVQQDSCWKNITFEGPCSVSNTSDKAHVFLTSSWLRNFRGTPGHRGLGLKASSNICKVASSTNHPTREKGKKAFTSYPDVKSEQCHASVSYLRGEAVIGNNAEVSDQNFADDDLRSTDQNGLCSAKRTKTLATDSPCDDQVVPFSEAAPRGDNPGGKQSFSSISPISTASN
ncbi:hypothetical protein MLD38_001752 [Melastoma candidum]|uniref:Uncharacterized protein n=1 Tax=Melastoma candidum TaxID=119954 RepID=A0ACB9SDK5_9MYRT|nr:hypothetical protein MLD38_001752 [Melastoma candidum]